MQDVTGKVSLGHILYLLIFITVLGPHCHELWVPARLGNVCFPAKCLSLNEPHGGLGLVQGTFSASWGGKCWHTRQQSVFHFQPVMKNNGSSWSLTTPATPGTIPSSLGSLLALSSGTVHLVRGEGREGERTFPFNRKHYYELHSSTKVSYCYKEHKGQTQD